MSLSPWPESALMDWSSVETVEDVVFFREAVTIDPVTNDVEVEAVWLFSFAVTASRLTTSEREPALACLWNSCLVEPTCLRALLTEVNSLELEGDGDLEDSLRMPERPTSPPV